MDSTIYNGLQAAPLAQTFQKGINLTGDGTRISNMDFQQLMEQTQSSQPDSEASEQPKTEQPPKAEKPAAPKKVEKEPVRQQEDPVETSRKAQIVAVGQLDPEVALEPLTLENPETGEDLAIAVEGWAPQVQEFDSAPEEFTGSFIGETDAGRIIDVSDPEADQMLEAAAPDAEFGPGEVLEQAATEEAGQVAQQAVRQAAEKAPRPQAAEEDGGAEVEIIGAEQAPQKLFHDVKAAPVKVGEVYEAPETEQTSVVRQIDNGLAQAMEKGGSYVRIQLDPESLGTVTVEIGQSADGILRVAISAHSGETRSLLERHAADLQGMLSSRTQQTVQVEVERHQESQQGQDQHPYDGHNRQDQSGRQQEQHQRREHTGSQDFFQQLRLGLIPTENGTT